MLKGGGTPLFDANERTHRRQDNPRGTIAQFATRQKVALLTWRTARNVRPRKKNPLDRPAFRSKRLPISRVRENVYFFALTYLPLSPVKRILVSAQEAFLVRLLIIVLAAVVPAVSMIGIFKRVVLFRAIILAIPQVLLACA